MQKVLIADDDARFLLIIQAHLKPYRDRFEILTAEDGFEAIEILKREPISLLVTDLKMPRVEGLILISYLNRNFPEVPCIVMTSLRAPRLKERLQRDVLYYLEKPFKQKILVDAILTAVQRDTLNGAVQGISIASFLQLIQMELKTCLCEIIPPDGFHGYFYFKNGELYDATFGDLVGEAAALAMIGMERAEIHFRTLPVTQIERRIEGELTGLILEAMRRRDESRHSAGSPIAHHST